MAMTSKASSSRWARRSERRAPMDVVIAVLLVAGCIAVALGLSSCKNPLEEDELDSAPFQVANGDVTTYVVHDSETGELELLPVDDAKR
jgi:anti-sigma-K factor RskA